MRMALEALEHAGQTGDWILAGPAITALKGALAEPVEPVAWYCKEGLKRGVSLKQESPEWIPLYTKEKP